MQETKLSFGNEETLEEKLKIKSGAVSMLNIVNVNSTNIIFLIDNEILKSDKIGFHPNVNMVRHIDLLNYKKCNRSSC